MIIPWNGFMPTDSYDPRTPPTTNYYGQQSPARTTFLFNQLAAPNPAPGRKLIVAVNLFSTGVANPQVTSLLVNGEPATLLFGPVAANSINCSFWMIDNDGESVVDVDVISSQLAANIVVDLWAHLGPVGAPVAAAYGGFGEANGGTITLAVPANCTVFASENNKVRGTYSAVHALHKSFSAATTVTLSSGGGSGSAVATSGFTLDRSTSNIFATGNDVYSQRLTAVALRNA